jgi:hypothetical protein
MSTDPDDEQVLDEELDVAGGGSGLPDDGLVFTNEGVLPDENGGPV